MTISKYDEVIDSRDVIARIDALFESAPLDEDDAHELETLQALANEAEGYAADWHYGETLIRDSYFKQYAEALADDLGQYDPDATWPHNCIDWDEAAAEMQLDYTDVEFDEVTYWIR